MESFDKKSWTIKVLIPNLILLLTYGYWASGPKWEFVALNFSIFTIVFGLIFGVIFGIRTLPFFKTKKSLLTIIPITIITNLFAAFFFTGIIDLGVSSPIIEALNNNTPKQFPLGEQKYIYFKDDMSDSDGIFKLNFTFKGKQEVTSGEIGAMGRQWLTKNGYNVGKLDQFYYQRNCYSKDAFSLKIKKDPSIFNLVFEIKEFPPSKPNTKLEAIQPKYQDGTLTFDYAENL